MLNDWVWDKRAARLALLGTVMAGLALGVVSATPSVAQEQDDEIIGSLTEEEAGKVRAFGREVGQAFLCASDSDRDEMRNDIRLIFNFMAQDMGTDAAFAYAVSVGIGTQKDKGSLDCDGLLVRWDETRQGFSLTEPEQ